MSAEASDGLIDPFDQFVLMDAEIDPHRFLFENVPMDNSPEFSIGELVKFFFARTDYWLRWRERDGSFLLDGVQVGGRRTTSGARVWNLAEVEQMLHAACRNGAISGAQLMAGLKMAKIVSINYKILVA